jgi:nitroreductase / dihydropteridine reductase
MEFKDIVMQRYATKKFDGNKVPDNKINELVELIRYAPSGLNLQPWRIKIIDDQKTKDELVPFSFGQQQIATCSHLLVLCANTDFNDVMNRVSASLKEAGVPDEMRNMLMGMAEGMNKSMSGQEWIGSVKAAVYLALGNAVNGAKSLGLDSCPMTGFNPEGYARVLNLPSHLIPTALCPVGYAADTPMPKVRLRKEEILI